MAKKTKHVRSTVRKDGTFVPAHTRQIEVSDAVFNNGNLRRLKEQLNKKDAYVSFQSFKDKFQGVPFELEATKNDNTVRVYSYRDVTGVVHKKTEHSDGTLTLSLTNADGTTAYLTEVPGDRRVFVKTNGRERDMFIQTNSGEKIWEHSNAENNDYEKWEKYPDGQVNTTSTKPNGTIYTKADYPDGTNYTKLYQRKEKGDWTLYEKHRDGHEVARKRRNGSVFEIRKEKGEKEWVEPSVRHMAAINAASKLADYRVSLFNKFKGKSEQTKAVMELISEIFATSKAASQKAESTGFTW